MNTRHLLAGAIWMQGLLVSAQIDTLQSQSLDDVTVTARQGGTLRMSGAENGIKIGQTELFKAACCNLGESFTTNPSVDVNYSDATTGAKQIKLLGLSGTYVQMLTENLPNFRGGSIPLCARLCAWDMDEQHSGFQRCIICQERS